MADSENDSKFELECLRLASDLKQLAKDALNPDLKAHCLRIAKQWSGEADAPAEDGIGIDKVFFIDEHNGQIRACGPYRGGRSAIAHACR